MRKIICYFFGHKWELRPKPDILSRKAVCLRCKAKSLRFKHPTLGEPEYWEIVSDEVFNNPPKQA